VVQLKESPAAGAYTITERSGCRLVTGNVPLSALAMLLHGMPAGAVMDTHAARLLGVTIAIGPPGALESLISDPAVIGAARQKAQAAGPTLSDAAREWLATGQQGTSSMTIFQRLTGYRLTSQEHPPADPHDLGRCRRLLDQVPEFRTRLEELAPLSPVWARLVSEWDSLCALMDQEAPGWRAGRGHAPATYARMKALGC
jgi:hypothetical protein